MNKKARRFGAMLSAVFAALLAVALFPVNALADTTASLTVNGVTSGATVKIYKVVATTVDADTNAVTNTFVGTYGDLTMEAYVALTSNSDGMKTAADKIASVATTGAATDTKTADGTSVVFTGLDMGEYLVTVTPANDKGGVVYQNVIACIAAEAQADNTIAAKAATVDVKTTPVTITKTAKQGTEDLEVVSKFSKGDTVPYTVTVTVPTYPANATNKLFKVGDTMGTGLAFDTTSGVTIKDASGNALSADAYSVTTSATGFTVTFDYAKVANLAAQSLTITYNGTVTADCTPATVAENKAVVEFANNPYDANSHDTKDDKVTLKTFGIYLLKTDNSTPANPLPGATFTVYSDEACRTVVGTMTTDAQGDARIEDLGEGTYYVKETKAPAGYVASTATITVNLTEAGTNQTEGDANYHFMNAGTVVNNPQPALPVTGGAGTFALTGMGVALIAGAVVFTVRSRKDAKSER